MVVELFTSEVCSSCPPAESFLAHLETTQPVPGADIIVLAEHVDYWNQLGWRDRFASPLFTIRQQQYSRAFVLDSVYTPEMVVDGRAEFSGTDVRRAFDEVSKAAKQPHAVLTIRQKDKSTLALSVANLPPHWHDSEVFLAVTEDGLQSDVAKGENAGRHLTHTGVVRSLTSVARLDPKKTSVYAADVPLSFSGDWKRENLRVVLFVAERGSRRILGAASLAP